MGAHCSQPYLDYLCTQEGLREIWEKCLPPQLLKAIEEDQSQALAWMPPFPTFQDPKLGEYLRFPWPGDPNKEICVTQDLPFPQKTYIRHAHDFFEIAYIYRGQSRTQVSGVPTMIDPGDFCLYNLQAIHTMELLRPDTVVFNILVRKDLFRRFLLELLSESGAVSSFFLNALYNQQSDDTCIHLKARAGYRCEAMIQEMIELFYRNPPRCQTILKTRLFLLLTEIARQYEDEHAQVSLGSTGSLKLTDVISYISSSYPSVTLEDVAQHFGYSSRSMTRFLQKHTG